MNPTVGSSDVAGILGLSPWQSPWSVWSRLVGLVPRYSETDTAAQSRGRWMEPALAARYALDRGVGVFPGPQIGQPPRIGPEPWMHARPDFFVYTDQPTGVAWLLEVKTTRRYIEADGWGPDGTSRAPTHYAAQCTWEAVVCGVELVELVSYATIDEEQRIYPLRPSDRLRRGIVDRVRRWYDAHVVEGTPPPIDGSDACSQALARMHARGGPEHREATFAELDILERWRRARALSKRAKDEADRVANEVRAAIADDLGLRSGKEHLATWQTVRGRTELDRKALTRDHPEIAARYTTIGEPSRRLVCHGEAADAE